MEFLRFGSSIPGSYWGCCACDIIQNFKVDPYAKASIQLCGGDGGYPANGEKSFIGKTWREIFLQRLRFGTFGKNDMPNHGFIAILTSSQVSSGVGKKWLAILREQGFEFIRRVDNSVYSGQSVGSPSKNNEGNANYIFALFRNVGEGFTDQYTPPTAWTDLPKVIDEAWESDTSSNAKGKALTKAVTAKQKELYNALPKATFLSEAELDAAGIPVTYFGVRSGGAQPNAYQYIEGAPQELRELRKQREAERLAKRGGAPANAFPVKVLAASFDDLEDED